MAETQCGDGSEDFSNVAVTRRDSTGRTIIIVAITKEKYKRM